MRGCLADAPRKEERARELPVHRHCHLGPFWRENHHCGGQHRTAAQIDLQDGRWKVYEPSHPWLREVQSQDEALVCQPDEFVTFFCETQCVFLQPKNLPNVEACPAQHIISWRRERDRESAREAVWVGEHFFFRWEVIYSGCAPLVSALCVFIFFPRLLLGFSRVWRGRTHFFVSWLESLYFCLFCFFSCVLASVISVRVCDGFGPHYKENKRKPNRKKSKTLDVIFSLRLSWRRNFMNSYFFFKMLDFFFSPCVHFVVLLTFHIRMSPTSENLIYFFGPPPSPRVAVLRKKM